MFVYHKALTQARLITHPLSRTHNYATAHNVLAQVSHPLLVTLIMTTLVLGLQPHTRTKTYCDRKVGRACMGMRLHYDFHAQCHLVSYPDHPREIRSQGISLDVYTWLASCMKTFISRMR